VFPFALISTDGDGLGPVVFAEELQPGDVIPIAPIRHQRVLNVIPADAEDEYPLLYVDLLWRSAHEHA